VPEVQAPWEDGHFIGGHPALDLTNTVFNRAHPAADGELLTTPSDVVSWCLSSGVLATAPSFRDPSADGLVPGVLTVREQVWAVFDAVARDDEVPAGPFGELLERAGAGVRAGHVCQAGAAFDRVSVDPKEPEAIPAALALLAVHAVFTLPADRIRACGRCGWLFLDSSRGGRRRWCSMRTCGNREKASRHRNAE
jgi:predicted RNA-binding Zn ribbon-like protein